MDIKERNERIAQHTDIVTFGGKNLKKKTVDVTTYWNTLTRPPIKAYLPDWVVQKLYEYMTSARLINNPALRFKLTNELLLPWGFKPLASGTNRRAFYCTYDQGIIIKIASDAVGQKDNQSEFVIQQMLKPFCPKIFDVAGDGAILLSERGEPMTEHDYKFVWAEEIFDLLFSLLARGYILEDVGSNFYKNFGIRMGFGPMLWDFPYVYKLDWRKLICQKPDPITGQPCGGEIDYDYHKGMSEIVCTRCGARYSARYLASAMPSEAFSSVNRERRCIRVGRFDTKFEVFVRQGDKIVATYGNETATPQPQVEPRRNLMPGEEPNFVIQGVVTQQPSQPATVSIQSNPVVVNAVQQGLVMDQAMIDSTNQMYANPGTSVTVDTVRQDAVSQNIVAPYGPVPGQDHSSNYVIANQYHPPVPGKVVATPPTTPKRETIYAGEQKGITITPEEFLSLLATCQASGKPIPISLIQAAPELAATMLPNQIEPKYTKPIKSVGPVKDFEHYYENGKRYFMYPRDIRGQVYSWLNGMAQKFGDEVAVLLAEKLEIAFTPRKDPKPSTPSNPPRQEKADVRISFPRIMPSVKTPTPKVIARTSPQQVQSQIAGTHYSSMGHQMVQQSSVETVIAPRPERKMLDVENPNTWKAVSAQSQTTSEVATNNPPSTSSKEPQTTHLFPVKPMTLEEKEEADAKASNEQGITGFPGVAMVDSLRFKSEIPKVKAAVEARFSDFSLSIDDADRQIVEMAARIKDFIANDVATIMGTDTNGLEVNIVRTTDHRNNDCFKVDVLNYRSPVFMTVLYPNNKQVDEALTQAMEEEQARESIQEEASEDSMQIPQEDLEAFFASSLKEFDSSKYNTVEEVKNELVSFLLGRLLDTYNKDGIQRITTPRAYKEANAYVEQAVEIQDNTAKQSTQSKPKQEKSKVVPPQPAPKMASGSAGASL